MIGELGVSHLGNDRTDNPFFRGQTVSLKGRQMRIKLVRALNAMCFPALWWTCLRSGSVAFISQSDNVLIVRLTFIDYFARVRHSGTIKNAEKWFLNLFLNARQGYRIKCSISEDNFFTWQLLFSSGRQKIVRRFARGFFFAQTASNWVPIPHAYGTMVQLKM